MDRFCVRTQTQCANRQGAQTQKKNFMGLLTFKGNQLNCRCPMLVLGIGRGIHSSYTPQR